MTSIGNAVSITEQDVLVGHVFGMHLPVQHVFAEHASMQHYVIQHVFKHILVGIS